MRISLDGSEIRPQDRFICKAHLLEEVPNLVWCVGYTNASWTLRADITARATAKLIEYMNSRGYTHAYPASPTSRCRKSWHGTSRPVTCCATCTCSLNRALAAMECSAELLRRRHRLQLRRQSRRGHDFRAGGATTRPAGSIVKGRLLPRQWLTVRPVQRQRPEFVDADRIANTCCDQLVISMVIAPFPGGLAELPVNGGRQQYPERHDISSSRTQSRRSRGGSWGTTVSI